MAEGKAKDEGKQKREGKKKKKPPKAEAQPSQENKEESKIDTESDQSRNKDQDQDQDQDQPDEFGENKLETPWTFYYDKKLAPRSSNLQGYESNLRKLGTFGTLEGFWRYFSHLKEADNIPKDHNLFMFRNNETPAWETFPNGGCWIIKVRKHNGIITRLWEELCFAAAGELFEEPDLAGVVLSSRGHDDNLSIWNRDNLKYPDVRLSLGEKLRTILNLDESTKVEYKPFKAAIREGSTYRNAKPYVYAAQGYVGGLDPGVTLPDSGSIEQIE